MPTYFKSAVSDSVCSFAVALASAARVFTTNQVSRHPDLSWRSQPDKRARELLGMHRDTFENSGGTWRLTKRARRHLEIDWKPIDSRSQRIHHWLGVGDIWLTLTFAGGRPTEWRTEWDRQFDVYCAWQRKPYLIEYQRTPITTFKWQQKWHKRIEWYKQQQWVERPRVVLVNMTGQMDETISAPKGTIHVKQVDDLPKTLRPPR